MRPRANFSCKHCNDKIEDLPIDSVRCPICGFKRGFVRLFDALGGVMGSKTNNLDGLLKQTLDPLYEKHADTTDSAKSFAKASQEALDRSTHEAAPADRAKAAPFGGRLMPAGAALGAIPPEARRDSRDVIYPALTNRQVRPLWERQRKPS